MAFFAFGGEGARKFILPGAGYGNEGAAEPYGGEIFLYVCPDVLLYGGVFDFGNSGGFYLPAFFLEKWCLPRTGGSKLG